MTSPRGALTGHPDLPRCLVVVFLRGAAFFVPGGWGFQEGGFIVFGGLVGFPADFMLAVSLATRGRELLVSVPGLLAWQHIEGRSLWKRHIAKHRG